LFFINQWSSSTNGSHQPTVIENRLIENPMGFQWSVLSGSISGSDDQPVLYR
jgi:hypothetical protein